MIFCQSQLTVFVLMLASIPFFLSAYQTEHVPFETVVEEIEVHKSTCRSSLKNLTQDHPLVLEQFDKFTEKLTDSYLAGEGFIHKDIHRILDAIDFAAHKHQFQKRKDALQTPYIIHPIGVAHILITIGNVRDTAIIIGALLHDTVEDTGTTFEEVEEKFGAAVAGFVREVTDDKSLPKEVRKQLQIEHAPQKSAGAAQIKLGDKLYNLSDLVKQPPSDWAQERIDAYFVWAQSVVDNLPWVNAPLKKAVDEVIKGH